MSNILDNCVKSINNAKNLRALNFFIKETFDLALNQAEKSHNRLLKNSKLDGKIFTIKDNICTQGINTTCGSKMLESYVPPYNATVVEKLFNSGAILLGKTNLDEFGMGSVSSSYFGTTKNPFNLKTKSILSNDEFYISGGSSGGSAASVSAGLCDFSIGSDTGGSVRNPASMCGCIGYKPTYGLISRNGLIPLNNYLDTIGIMTRDMPTLVEVLNIIAGPDDKDATSIKSAYNQIELKQDLSLSQIKIGIPQEFFPNGLSGSNLEAWKRSVQIFEDIGKAKIVPVSLPNTTYTMSCYSVLTSCEVASNFARYDGLRFGYHSKLDLDINKADEIEYILEKIIKQNRNESLGKVVKSRIFSGNYFLLKKKAFEQVDILVTPTCFHDTVTYAEYLKKEQVFDEKDFFTACANIAGVPAISIPSILSKNGLPVGVQLIAKWNQDDQMLNLANWFINNNSENFPYKLNFDKYF